MKLYNWQTPDFKLCLPYRPRG